MKKILRGFFAVAAVAGILFSSAGCQKDELDGGDGGGISNIRNPWDGDTVLSTGETVSISFDAASSWEASIETSDGGDWAQLGSQTNNTSSGRGTVRVYIDENQGDERSVNIYITVSGYDRTLLCTLVQAQGDTQFSRGLNTQMDTYLRSNYLWNREYTKLSDNGDIDLDVSWSDFLETNLVKLGDINIEDGGTYKDFYVNRGERYIYSYINEITSTKASGPVTKANSTVGLGIGPSNAIRYSNENDMIVFVVGYVYPDSPAYNAGLRRGDMIYAVNGTQLTSTNYGAFQQELYYSTQGTYRLNFMRFVTDFEESTQTTMDSEATVTAGPFVYNPVLFFALIQDQGLYEDAEFNIAYLVLESFDLGAQRYLEDALQQFKDAGVEDLILDLRFCPGGALDQSRYLASSIAGQANYKKTFADVRFNEDRKAENQIWTFEFSDESSSGSGIGVGPDLGLSELHVICSENTASAAEVLINSLRGIDFPVYLYGSKTEGKNVGMEVQILSNGARTFEFSPITFYPYNAKGFIDFADGFEVDYMVNDQDSDMSSSDDIDYNFPYEPNDWENWSIDPPVFWAFNRIVYGTDPDWGSGSGIASKSGNRLKMANELLGDSVKALKQTSVNLKPGKFGSVIYHDDIITIDAE